MTATTATLHGELNPGSGSERLSYDFTYGIGSSCDEEGTAPQPPGEAEGNHQEVSAAITALEPNTQYTYCLSASDAEEQTEVGSPVPFTTHAEAPAIDSESTASESVTPFDAALEAQINPENEVTTYHFEYGTSNTLSGARSIGESSLSPGVRR